MFEHILAAIDTSPVASRVLDAAADLALKSKGEVVVAHVRDVALPLAMTAAAGRAGGIGRGVPTLEDEAAAQQLVQDAVNRLAEAGVPATGRVGSSIGATARELLELAAEFQSDVIVVGSHGSHVRQVVLGSVAYRIVHLATCSVLVVR